MVFFAVQYVYSAGSYGVVAVVGEKPWQLEKSKVEELYIMPYDKERAFKRLVGMIRGASDTIDISVYSFTNKFIARSVKEASQRGVRVRLIYDFDADKTNSKSVIRSMRNDKNVSVCALGGVGRKRLEKHPSPLMHQKMVIVDKSLIGLGSANWSRGAFEINYETLLVINSSNLVHKAIESYEKMFSSCRRM